MLWAKTGDLLRREYDWTPQVAALAVPTLLVFADADAIPVAHMAEFYGLLGGGHRDPGSDGTARPTSRLAVLPGLTHQDIPATPSCPTWPSPSSPTNSTDPHPLFPRALRPR